MKIQFVVKAGTLGVGYIKRILQGVMPLKRDFTFPSGQDITPQESPRKLWLLRYDRFEFAVFDDQVEVVVHMTLCPKCQGSGRYVVKGQDKGPCFKCKGTGEQ